MNNKSNNFEYGLQENETMTVTLTLEEDTELDCDVVAIFQVQDKDYVALLPRQEEPEVFLYRLGHTDSYDAELENIEDERELELVASAFDALTDEEN